jgi:hypothetical protein
MDVKVGDRVTNERGEFSIACGTCNYLLRILSLGNLERDYTLEDRMQAAFYVKQGPAREVLQVGEQPTAEPGPGEVRVHLKTSGVNPSDWKSRSGRTAPMSAPLIILIATERAISTG